MTTWYESHDHLFLIWSFYNFFKFLMKLTQDSDRHNRQKSYKSKSSRRHSFSENEESGCSLGISGSSNIYFTCRTITFLTNYHLDRFNLHETRDKSYYLDIFHQNWPIFHFWPKLDHFKPILGHSRPDFGQNSTQINLIDPNWPFNPFYLIWPLLTIF